MTAAGVSAADARRNGNAAASREPLWFLGTFARMKLESQDTGGQFALWEAVVPRNAAPPLHSHPQDETFYVLDGELTVWIVEPEACDDRAWVEERARRCGPGSVMFAPAGMPHTFRAESDTARMLVLSVPAGIDEYVRALSEPAQWPWLQPPPEGPRVDPERLAAIEREMGMVRHSPPPPPR
jgi:quercetin dioxygenase-like cupin family protein